MEAFGRAILLGSKFPETVEWEKADEDRSTPLVAGKEGEGLRRRVWGEIMEVLEKDVPEVKEALRMFEAS